MNAAILKSTRTLVWVSHFQKTRLFFFCLWDPLETCSLEGLMRGTFIFWASSFPLVWWDPLHRMLIYDYPNKDLWQKLPFYPRLDFTHSFHLILLPFVYFETLPCVIMVASLTSGGFSNGSIGRSLSWHLVHDTWKWSFFSLYFGIRLDLFFPLNLQKTIKLYQLMQNYLSRIPALNLEHYWSSLSDWLVPVCHVFLNRWLAWAAFSPVCYLSRSRCVRPFATNSSTSTAAGIVSSGNSPWSSSPAWSLPTWSLLVTTSERWTPTCKFHDGMNLGIPWATWHWGWIVIQPRQIEVLRQVEGRDAPIMNSVKATAHGVHCLRPLRLA